MTRYRPARHYLVFACVALALAGLSGWFASHYAQLALLASLLFLATAVCLLALAFRPAIEVHEGHLAVGRRVIPWMDIRRVDRTGWISPLLVRLTLYDESRVMLIYPGDVDSCNTLLRQLRRRSRDAQIDGVPYRQYWGEVSAYASSTEQAPMPPRRYRVLRPEDEAEVERLYQLLKTVGHLDQKNSGDEN
jgi:hypothetical protein